MVALEPRRLDSVSMSTVSSHHMSRTSAMTLETTTTRAVQIETISLFGHVKRCMIYYCIFITASMMIWLSSQFF